MAVLRPGEHVHAQAQAAGAALGLWRDFRLRKVRPLAKASKGSRARLVQGAIASKSLRRCVCVSSLH